MVSAQMPELRNFYKHLYEKGWNVSGYGDNKDERDLLERFHYVVDVFLDLKPGYGSTSLAFAFVFLIPFLQFLTPNASHGNRVHTGISR
jgi:hypothetical protein